MSPRNVFAIAASLALVTDLIVLGVFRTREEAAPAVPATPSSLTLTYGQVPKAGSCAQNASDSQTIERIRRLSAKRIDTALPDLPLEEWLASVLPASSQIEWALTDCGEQTGDPSVDSKVSIPTCVTASARIAGERLDISMSLGEESDTLELRRLSSMPSYWRQPRTVPETALRRMRWVRGILDAQGQQAKVWWQLESAAESLATALPPLSVDSCYDRNSSYPRPECPGVEFAKESERLSIRMESCWPGDSWLPGNEGHAKYLEVWPNGPRADVAFWRTRIEPPCCDECGPQFRNEASRKNLEQACKEFIEKFPKSSLRRKGNTCEVALKKAPQPGLLERVAGPPRTPILVLHFIGGEGTKVLAASQTVESFALYDERGMREVARVRLEKDLELKWSDPRTLVFRFGEAEVRPDKTEHEVTLLELKDHNLQSTRTVKRKFAPGARLELIAYAAEGYLNARYKGEYMQIFGQDLHILRAPGEEVWVRLDVGGKAGWARLDSDIIRVIRVTF